MQETSCRHNLVRATRAVRQLLSVRFMSSVISNLRRAYSCDSYKYQTFSTALSFILLGGYLVLRSTAFSIEKDEVRDGCHRLCRRCSGLCRAEVGLCTKSVSMFDYYLRLTTYVSCTMDFGVSRAASYPCNTQLSSM